MKPVGADDYFEVRQLSLVSDVDRLSLSDLYLPLIGAHGFAIYNALLLEAKAKGLRLHEDLFLKLGLTPGQFEQAMPALEAMALVRTFYRHENGVHVFVYCLYAPLTPKEFFDDVLFCGTLKRTIGEKKTSVLMQKYQLGEEPKGYEDISTGFVSYFRPDFDDPAYDQQPLDNIGGHNTGRIKIQFDPRRFFGPFLELGYGDGCLTDDELKKIERLSALYAVDSRALGEMAVDCFYSSRPRGSRIDFRQLEKNCQYTLSFRFIRRQEKAEKSEISGESIDANHLRVMDMLNPTEYLKYLQNRHQPGESDLKLIAHLALDLGLPDPVINAILWVTIRRHHDSLPYAYADKIGSALARVGCKTARDAMDYLLSDRATESGSYKAKPTEDTSDSTNQKETSEEEGEETSKEDLDAMMAEFYASKQGK